MAKNTKQTMKAATPRGKAAAAPQYGIVAAANNPKMYTPYLQVASYFGISTKIIHNPDPTLKLTQTRGRGQMAYQDMLDKDPHLAGLCETRFEAVVSCPREVLPSDDSPEAAAISETVTRVIDGIDELEDSLEEMLNSRINGFRVAEIEYERWSDGTVGVKKLHSVPPDAILFDVDGNTRLRTTTNTAEGEIVPDRKFIVMRHKATSMNPYGVGLGRSLWWYSWFKREALKFWLVFVEKFGQPTVLGKHPAQWTEVQQNELLEILRNIASESAIRVPSDVEIMLLEATRSGNVTSYESLCKWIDDSMAKRVLGQELSSTAKNIGLNSSQGNLAGEVRQDIKTRDARALRGLLGDTLVRWIVDFNYGVQDPQDYPRLLIHAEPPQDLSSLADTIGKAMDIGIRVPERWARTKLGIPEPVGNEAVLNDVQAEQTRAAMPAGLGSFGGPVDPNADPNADPAAGQ